MSVLSPATKATVGVKTAKTVAKHPGVLRTGAKVGKPVVKRRVKRRAGEFGASARDFGESARDWIDTIVTYGPEAAQNLGLVEAPKPKRTAPRVAAGVVIGATAVYVIEHREQVKELIG
jgi:hypothetical protein